MTAQILNIWDYKRPEERKACENRFSTEPPIDLAKIESEIAFALWGGPIFPSIVDIPTDYDPRPA